MDKPPRILIVGQGIAGTVLHFTFLKHGIRAGMVDHPHPGRASVAAAGIINPITGPKYQKSWNFDNLLAVFVPFYTSLESFIGQRVFYRMRMFRYLFNLEQINRWTFNSDNEGPATCYGKFAGTLGEYPEESGEGSWAEIHHAFRVDLNVLMDAYRGFLKKEALLRESSFDFDLLHMSESGAVYDDQRFDYILFCEGYKMEDNPYFSYLPLVPAKGDALLVRRAVDTDFMAKRNELLTYWDSEMVWYGATLKNRFDTTEPDLDAYRTLCDRYAGDFHVTPDVIRHLSGLRPTVRDRRPLVGLHPEFPVLGILNGLGTKGTSLAPLMAKYLVDKIMYVKEIPEEISISRFRSD